MGWAPQHKSEVAAIPGLFFLDPFYKEAVFNFSPFPIPLISVYLRHERFKQGPSMLEQPGLFWATFLYLFYENVIRTERYDGLTVGGPGADVATGHSIFSFSLQLTVWDII